VAGSTGAAATFSWMEPFRPYLIGVTVLVLGFAWYQKLKPVKAADDCGCELTPGKKPFMQTKTFLSIITIFAVAMLSFPNYAHIFYPETESTAVITEVSNIQKVHFDIKGMTCQGCSEHIKHAVSENAGIVRVDASWEKGEATVEYDASVLSLDTLTESINATGYTVVGTQSIKESSK
jgi:copper chaperone CopZ